MLTGVLLKDQGETGYETASVPDASDTKDAYVLVRFAPGASAQEITKFLDEHRVMWMEPKPGGLFRVRLAVTGTPKEALAAAVKSLQDNTKVVGFVAASE